MEELEVDPTGAQRFVQRSEDHLAHAHGHLPKERALVVHQRFHAEQRAQPGAEPLLLRVSAGVREHQVVQPADVRGFDGGLRSAVATDPVAELLVVEFGHGARVSEQPVDDRAPDDGGEDADQVPALPRAPHIGGDTRHDVARLPRARRRARPPLRRSPPQPTAQRTRTSPRPSLPPRGPTWPGATRGGAARATA